MYKIPKQRYTQEFKQEAVRQVESEGRSPAQVARELGIAEQTLSNWRKAGKAGKLGANVGKPITPEQMELSLWPTYKIPDSERRLIARQHRPEFAPSPRFCHL